MSLLQEKYVILIRKDVVITRKISRYNEKRSCYNKKYYVCGSNVSPYYCANFMFLCVVKNEQETDSLGLSLRTESG